MAGADPFHARNRGKLRQNSSDESYLAGNGENFVGQCDIEVNGVSGIEAGIDMDDVEHAADEQSRADEECESEGGLGDDQGMMEAISTAAGCGRIAAIAKGGGGIGLRHAPGRK